MPGPDGEEEEEDYMSMVIDEPRARETFSQRKLRLQREAEAKARVPSKAERAAAEQARREQALAESVLDPANRGYKMMLKLGFAPGGSLGRRPNPTGDTSEAVPTSEAAPTAKDRDTDTAAASAASAASEPIRISIKEDRGGIGLDSEKKRKFRSETAGIAKRSRADADEYRERMRLEREERRVEGQVRAAQMVLEKLDTEAEAGGEDAVDKKRRVNVLYRGLVREREEREREKLVRQMLETSLPSSFFPKPRLPGVIHDDGNEEGEEEEEESLEQRDDRVNTKYSLLEQDGDEEDDPELDAFNALSPGERLQRLVLFLRERHWYCFWCKSRYEDAGLEGCPGITEEDHD